MTIGSSVASLPAGNGAPRCVPWHAKYREGVLRLFAGVPYKAELWSWQFESNPFGLPFDPVVLVDSEDRVAGFNGVMPILASDKGEEMHVLWSCDFYLSEKWREQGLGSKIKHELHKKAPVILAFGVSDRASDVLQHLGWVANDTVRIYKKFRRRKGPRRWLLTTLQWINRLTRFHRLSTAPNPPGIRMSVRSSLPGEEDVNALWERCFADYGKVVRRDFSYLDWRYQKHPLGRYAFVAAWLGDELSALLVVRFSRSILRIVDYCGPARSLSLKRNLIGFTVNHWRHTNQIVSVTSDSELGACFLSEGFVQLRDRPRFYAYEASPDTSSLPSKWFIMGGDSDGEFLQAASDFSFAEALPGEQILERWPC